MDDIVVRLEYDVKEGKFEITGNAKSPKSIVENFIRVQVGAGKDESKAIERDVYKIELRLDLSQDVFTCRHDCGNKGLREGILMQYVSKG